MDVKYCYLPFVLMCRIIKTNRGIIHEVEVHPVFILSEYLKVPRWRSTLNKLSVLILVDTQVVTGKRKEQI